MDVIMKSELTTITVQLVYETEKAVLVNDGTKQVWIPKAQCEIEQYGAVYELTLPVRVAEEKGLV